MKCFAILLILSVLLATIMMTATAYSQSGIFRFIEMSDFYSLGEEFEIKFEKTTRQPCQSYEISLMNQGIPESKITYGREPLCAIPGPVEPYLFNAKFEKLEFFDKVGTYIIQVTFDEQTITKTITIVDGELYSEPEQDRPVYDNCGPGTELQDGICIIKEQVNDTNSSEKWTNSYQKVIPPLEQFNSGIPFNEIQCKDDFVLIQKYDGTPACVTFKTKEKLIERGWATGKSWTISHDKPEFTPQYGTSEFDAEYDKAHEIYLDARKSMNLPFIGLTVDVNDRNIILLGINSDKLTKEKNTEYYEQLVDEIFQDVNLNIVISYKNTTGLIFDE